MAITQTLQPDATDGKDTGLAWSPATTNYGTATNFIIGSSASPNWWHLLIDFYDIVNKEFPIWKSRSIKEVYIDLNVTSSTATNKAFQVHEILRDWVESEATWNVWKTGNNWTAAGGTGAGDSNGLNYFAFLGGSGVTGSYKIYIDPYYFERMMNRSNYGFLLRQFINDGGTANSNMYVDLSDHATPANRPKLVIIYEPYHKIYMVKSGLGQVK